MYYLTITTFIHAYLLNVFSAEKIKVNVLTVILFFSLVALKVKVFLLLGDGFNTFIFAWFCIFVLALILFGRGINVRRSIELAFFIELINAMAYYTIGGLVLILTGQFDVSDIINFNLVLKEQYIPQIIITNCVMFSFGIFRKYIPLRFLLDGDLNFGGIMVILGINGVIKIMYDMKLSNGIKLMLLVCMNILVVFFYAKNKKLQSIRIKDIQELQEKEKNIDELKLYIETIEELIEKFKEYRHDSKNILLGIGYEDEKINKLIDTLEESVKETTHYNIFLSLKEVKYPSLKSLLYYYIMNTLKEGIEVRLTVLGKINDIKGFDNLEFSRMIGILFENALESALESSEKQVNIYIEGLDGQLNITIGNTFSEPAEDIEQLFNKGYSTKGENRGLGLYNLRTIINRNPHLSLNTTINEGFFIQDLYIHSPVFVH